MEEVPKVSNYTSGLSYGAIDFTHTYFTGAAFILSRVTDVEQIGHLYRWTPWQGLLMLPIAALAIYGRLTKSFGLPMSPLAVIVLYAFVSFSNYPMISWSISGGFSSPLGWIILLSLYLFILARTIEGRVDIKWTLLIVMTVLLAQPTYHTVALALMVMLVLLWAIQQVARREYISPALVLITGVAFLSFLMYHAISVFQGYWRLLSSFLTDIYRSHDKELLKYSLKILDVSLWWHVVNYAAILVPVVWSGIILIRRKYQTKLDAYVVIYQWSWLFPLIPLAIIFYAWGGVFSAYERLLQYGTLLAIACSAFLLATRRKSFQVLATAAAVCVLISVILTTKFNIATGSGITIDEQAAIEWMTREMGCESTVFTDFRIGSTIGYWGCFSVIGPSANPLFAQGRKDIITSLLYDGDRQRLKETLDVLRTANNQKPKLILLSRRFMDPHIGFVLPDTRMKPISETQWQTYRNLDGWRVVFENNTAMVLARDDL
jgi:hypothetical protein